MNSKVKDEFAPIRPRTPDAASTLRVHAALRKASAQTEFEHWIALQYDQISDWLATTRRECRPSQ